ncbi:hypothetical protein [Streptomyces tubercidicus]|uniref:Lipoprotein n=1 Tax=Streptomyces tubercidicus TaxID=47759 RepID=A0A640UWC1_9ACTN|nr:hypothetical protein [Streptomyces tubercidicus]WAU13395.1 hypothetical protein STRTU_003889 [Streptomyces tubercidicus]GFE38991.1 hypothetical protein Stube_36640 [Streptomyces tubercidicus]
MTEISRLRALCLVASALLLTGCGKEPTPTSKLAQSPTASASATLSPAEKFKEWADTGGSEIVNTIGKDLSAVDKDSHPADLEALKDSCAQLTADLEVAQGGEAMPDRAMASRWVLALKHLKTSAAACTDGANGADQASFDKMAAEMSIGTKHLSAVVKRLSEVTG